MSLNDLSKSRELGTLMQKSGLWKASSIGDQFKHGTPTGFPLLDAHLPGNGWPSDGVTELLLNGYGLGELRLLAPALASLSRTQGRHIVMVSPPFIPYPPALSALGIHLPSVMIVRPGDSRDLLWVLEQALSSKSCSAVIAWPGLKKRNSLLEKQIRRLQLASREGNTWHILFRHTSVMQDASPAELRILLRGARYAPLRSHSAVDVKILKRRGGWETETFTVPFDDTLNLKTPDFTDLSLGTQRRRAIADSTSPHQKQASGLFSVSHHDVDL